MGRSAPARALPTLLAALSLTLAGPAGAADPSCVTACRAEAEACALRCRELTGAGLEACEIACAEALFVECVTRCQETGRVTPGDYEVVVPGGTSGGEASGAGEEGTPSGD